MHLEKISKVNVNNKVIYDLVLSSDMDFVVLKNPIKKLIINKFFPEISIA